MHDKVQGISEDEEVEERRPKPLKRSVKAAAKAPMLNTMTKRMFPPASGSAQRPQESMKRQPSAPSPKPVPQRPKEIEIPETSL